MRMNTPAQTELRKEKIEQTEQLGNACTVGYQCVHVCRAVSELFPGTDKEITSQPEYNWGGQYP